MLVKEIEVLNKKIGEYESQRQKLQGQKEEKEKLFEKLKKLYEEQYGELDVSKLPYLLKQAEEELRVTKERVEKVLDLVSAGEIKSAYEELGLEYKGVEIQGEYIDFEEEVGWVSVEVGNTVVTEQKEDERPKPEVVDPGWGLEEPKPIDMSGKAFDPLGGLFAE